MSNRVAPRTRVKRKQKTMPPPCSTSSVVVYFHPSLVDKMMSKRVPYDPIQFLDDDSDKFVFLYLNFDVFIIKCIFRNR